MTEKLENTLCSDGIYRKVHLPDCDCDDCWENRALITRLRDGEAMDLYKGDFEGLTEQECFDLLQKGDEGTVYASWRAALRTRTATADANKKP